MICFFLVVCVVDIIVCNNIEYFIWKYFFNYNRKVDGIKVVGMIGDNKMS